ncbi:hypothetical protein Tco_1289837, partial [Tanacetum coccineum]
MEPQLGLYVRLGEILGLRFPTIGIRARLGPVVVWMVFPRLDPGSTVLVDPGKPCTERKPVKRRGVPMVKVGGMIKGGIVAIVEGEAHCALGLRGGLLGVQTQSHIGRIIISKLTYKLGGLLLLSPIGFRMEPQLGLYVRLGEILGLRFPTIGIRARLGPVVVWMVFPRLDPGRRYEKGGIVAIVEGEAHGALGLRGGLLGVQTQSHIGKIIISKLTYKLGGLLLLSPIGFRMEPQLGLYVRLGEMLGLGYPTIGIRARLGPVVVWMVFPRLDPGRRYEKGGIVAIVEGEAHGGLGLRGGLLGVQTQSHIGRIIISKLTYKLGGLLLLSPIGFGMEPQLGLYVRLVAGVGLLSGKGPRVIMFADASVLPCITSLKCVLTQEHLDAICAKYFVPEEVHPQLPSSDATMHERPTGKVGMYTRFFDYANYRIPFSTFFVSVLTHFRIPFSQLSVFGSAK